MELFYEQNVVNNNIDERIKRTKILTFAKIACIVIAVTVLLTIMLFITDDSFLMMLGIFIAISMPFIIAAVIIGHVNKRNNTEFDYLLDGDELKISEVYFRESRKLKRTITMRSIESVGVFDSDGYKRAEMQAQKKYLALVNFDDEDSILYILYNTPKGKCLLFLEPDRGFIMTLRRSLSSLTVFDKSVSELEKKLNKAAEEQ